MKTSRQVSNYCTTRKAAELLDVSLRTAQLWVESGLLEAWKTRGGHRRISITSVEKLLADKQDRSNLTVKEPSDRLKLLVAEDDSVLLKLYKLRIAHWGLPIEVMTATNGFDVLILIGRESPDLMVTDLNMPGLDGFKMVRLLESSPFREGMEIVVVTGLDEPEIAERGGIPDGIRIFPKPVPFSELRSICENLLARREKLLRMAAE